MLEITPELQKRIETHVCTGVFSQPSEVLHAALDILEERQQEYSQLDAAIDQ
jgi:putative addiction module CopG family antidote